MKQLTCASVLLVGTLIFGVQSTMADTLGNQDLAFAFGSDNTSAMQTLSNQEMVETEGAWVWWAASGLVGGVANTLVYGANNGWSNPAGLAYSFGTGVGGGLIGGLGFANNVSKGATLGFATAGALAAGSPLGGWF